MTIQREQPLTGLIKMLTVSLAQIEVETADPQANLKKTSHYCKEAKEQGANLIVFPEMWTVGFNWNYNRDHASDHAATLESVKTIASEHGIWIHGSLPAVVANGQIANRSVLISPDGQLVSHYDKTHLFSFVGEEKHMASGMATTLIKSPFAACGLAICYDLRFPELFRKYAVGGAEIIFLPSAFPEPRLAHWRTLVRARAIENQLFMIACNQVGTVMLEKEVTFFGSSCIIDPWGETIIEGGSDEQLLTAEIDLAKVDEIRNLMHVLDDRRPELY